MRKLLAGLLLVILVLSALLPGCSTDTGGTDEGSKVEVVPPPTDEFRYEVSRTIFIQDTGKMVTIPTDFTLLDKGPKIDNFCAGCRAEYFIAFWYVPLQTDYFLGDAMMGNKTTDFAILSKPAFKCDDIRVLNEGLIPSWMGNRTKVDYLDSIYSVNLRDKNRNIITIEPSLQAVSYNPLTQELIVSGFPPESQNYFSVTYFHNQDGKFNIYYEKPDPMSQGFAYTAEAQNWVELPGTQIVSPFAVRCAPVNLVIPGNTTVPDKFEFCIGVVEAAPEGGSGIKQVRGLQQRWLISCREETY